MTEKSLGREWVAEAQKLLLSLRDIAGASITVSEDGTSITEVNVLAEGHRPPKQIVRDVRSALRAEYQVDVDYRRISVAQRREPEADRASEDDGPTILTLPAAHVEEEPSAQRFRFQGVNLAVAGGSAQVQVELSLGDREAVGESAGVASGIGISRLVAQATLDAVAKFLDPSSFLDLRDIQVVTLGGEEIALVSISLVKARNEKSLTGSAPARPTLQEGVAYATLCALNRVLGRLRYREPIEYQVRPTSTTY